jgi:uncharacterized protein
MEVTNHTEGAFCFAELVTSDTELARRFYGELFGWTSINVPGSTGSYSLFQLRDKTVAGLRQIDHGPHRWVPFLKVESVDALAARVRALGGILLDAPSDGFGLARTVTIRDPGGAVVGLRESTSHAGSELAEEPGSIWWIELLTREIAAVRTFYSNLMGWDAGDVRFPHLENPYTLFKIGQESVAGAIEIERNWGTLPPRWQVLFAVDDCDARLARARMLGGVNDFEPIDVPRAGRLVGIRDPADAHFVIVQGTTATG